MNLNSKSAAVTFLAGLGLLIPAAIGLFPPNAPTVLSPLPMLTVLPAFFLSGQNLFRVAVAVPTLLFFIWNTQLFRGEAMIPKRSYVLLAAAAILSVIYFVGSWKWGLEYQGALYVTVVCTVNIASIAFLGFGFAWSWRRTPSFAFSLFWHWMLFAWLAWYAFPYLGELP